MPRHADLDWNLPEMIVKADGARHLDTANVTVAVLMDIREQLQSLNRLLNCPNFTGIPHTLQKIARQTAKPTKRRVKK